MAQAEGRRGATLDAGAAGMTLTPFESLIAKAAQEVVRPQQIAGGVSAGSEAREGVTCVTLLPNLERQTGCTKRSRSAASFGTHA